VSSRATPGAIVSQKYLNGEEKMGYSLSFIDSTHPSQPHERLEKSLPPTISINTATKSALLVESDESLALFLTRCLKGEGYAVRTASNSEEGLRLYRDCAPFNVVLIDYFVSHRSGVGMDCLAPQTKGVEFAMAIHDLDPSQGIIIAAFAYRSAGEVPRPPEAMHIPLLIDSNVSQLRSLLEKIEIDRAIRTLSPSDLLRLQRSAKFRVRGLGRAASGRDWEDLLGEALYRTLMGAEDTHNGRHWNRKVTFVHHLTGAMQSIANVWKRQFKENNTYLISELSGHNPGGKEQSPFDDVPSGCAAADDRLIRKSEEDRVLTLLQDSPDASHVFQGLANGLSKSEIMCRYSLDEKRYTTAVRRIRAKLLAEDNAGNRGR
jgi:CheY-like chemotaxis protein